MAEETERQIEKLERLRDGFRKAEAEKNRLEGRLAGLVADNKKRYGIATTKGANKRIKELSVKKKKLKKELDLLLNELDEEYIIWEN